MPIASRIPIVRDLCRLVDEDNLAYGKLSVLAGYSETTLRSWRSGDRNPALIPFIDFANLLGYQVVLVKKYPADEIVKGFRDA